MNVHTRFPPSFDDSPLSYAFALFSLALITSLSLSVVIGYALEERRRREIDRRLGNKAINRVNGMMTPVTLHRLIVSGFLLTIIFGALPDVLVLLAWGEAGEGTMLVLTQIDRLFDGATMLPFLFSVGVSMRVAGVVDHRLALEPFRIDLRPTWGLIRDKLKVLAAVLVIAGGVTLYKAGLP